MGMEQSGLGTVVEANTVCYTVAKRDTRLYAGVSLVDFILFATSQER